MNIGIVRCSGPESGWRETRSCRVHNKVHSKCCMYLVFGLFWELVVFCLNIFKELNFLPFNFKSTLFNLVITTCYHYAIDVYAEFELASRGSDFKGMSLLKACDCRSYKYDCFGGQVGTLIGVDGTSFDAPEQNRNSGEEGSVWLYGGRMEESDEIGGEVCSCGAWT